MCIVRCSKIRDFCWCKKKKKSAFSCKFICQLVKADKLGRWQHEQVVWNDLILKKFELNYAGYKKYDPSINKHRSLVRGQVYAVLSVFCTMHYYMQPRTWNNQKHLETKIIHFTMQPISYCWAYATFIILYYTMFCINFCL